MIHLPRRSVTRFFVPLIDVLILLFCIFLLMPFVSQPEKPPETSEPAETPPPPADAAELRRQLEESRKRLERLLAQRADLQERLSVKVLEIDGDTGRLYAFEPDGPEPRQEVRDAADAQRLIDAQKRRGGGKDVFFLLLYPRKLSGYPLARQTDAYRRWFKDVPIGFDNPWNLGAK